MHRAPTSTLHGGVPPIDLQQSILRPHRESSSPHRVRFRRPEGSGVLCTVGSARLIVILLYSPPSLLKLIGRRRGRDDPRDLPKNVRVGDRGRRALRLARRGHSGPHLLGRQLVTGTSYGVSHALHFVGPERPDDVETDDRGRRRRRLRSHVWSPSLGPLCVNVI